MCKKKVKLGNERVSKRLEFLRCLLVAIDKGVIKAD